MIVLRERRDDEVEAVLPLWRQADATVSVTDTLDDVRRAANGSTSVLLVAEQERRIVGSVIGGFDGWRGNIYRLVSDLEARLAAMGAKRITALVERGHPWATGFWDAVGYRLDAGMARYVRNL